MIGDELETMSWKLGQSVDTLCLLLDGLKNEGMKVTKGPAMAAAFVGRLRVYMGAFHLITDTIEATGERLEALANKEGGEHR